jgi:hypothetical protein
MFQLQITVHSIEEAERILACLKHSADPAAVKEVTDQINSSVESGEVNPKVDQAPAEKPKNPRGRPRRQVADPLPEPAAPEAEVTATPEAEAQAPAQQSHTLDDVREALMGVQNKTPGDMTACLAILEKFGAKRVSEVKPEDFAGFIAACKAA